ncbi:MAG: hypothetical protein F4038_01840 [Chloroflexi bacterium]|nr:hypothetical protein [Chloroflexota bacterium]MYJ91782.1 hypothetical protein [Chloroflexota bacterium]
MRPQVGHTPSAVLFYIQYSYSQDRDVSTANFVIAWLLNAGRRGELEMCSLTSTLREVARPISPTA